MMAKPKKNMKNVKLSHHDRIMLQKRAIIGCLNDELKNICKLQHTWHRSAGNFLHNILCAIVAYSLFPEKQSLIQFDN
ncbi:MAG: hypothetical protein PGN18_09015 [Pedobacter terrae]